ncbi:unnamed protein product [Urochloa decumbens]|uniref:Cathepsin propeptide inhibitor domain-containing protein n=1 Tax=Urochloa decumbens TaxID=240449 RepID=A0ABC8Z164_9POAL
MSLRALGSFLTRRFAQAESSLGIGINKAPGSAAGRPAACCLHTPRDLPIGDGSYGGARAASAAALTGLVALLYFNRKGTKKPGQEVLQGLQEEEELRVNFTDKDGKVNWCAYVEYLNTRRYRGGYGTEVTGTKGAAMDEVMAGSSDAAAVDEPEKDLEVDEEAMRARFDAWRKEYGRLYWTRKEKARRYEIFKESAIDCDRRNRRNASKPNGARFATGPFADWTKEEWESRMCCRSGPFDWEQYFYHRKAIIAEGKGEDRG